MFKKKEKDPNAKRLPFGKFMAWKSSDVSAAWVNWIVNTYILFYCTDGLHISAAVAGTLLLVTNIVDAVTDLLIGFYIDRAKITKFGKFRPYELAIVGVTICTAIMFMCPGEASDIVKYIWIFFTYTLAFSIFNTMRFGAQTPYMIRAFNNDRGLIGKVSSYGGFVTTMGAAAVTMTFPKLMGTFAYATDVTASGSVYHLNSAGWTKLILIFMVPATVIAIFRFLFVKEDLSIDTGKQAIPFNMNEVKKMIVQNKYIWMYALIILTFHTVQNLGVQSYYFQYVVGNTEAMSTISIMSYLLLPLMLVMPPLLKKFGATDIIFGACVISVIGYTINFFAGSNMILLVVGSVMTSICTLPISYLGSIILMELCNYNEYLKIARQESTTTALGSNLFSQIGQGVAPFVTGLILELTHYDAALTTQSAATITAIRILYSIVPGICIILIIIGARKLSKLEKKMPEIEAELAKARAE